jgi:hypothetical protein
MRHFSATTASIISKTMKISNLIRNPKNPRLITEASFRKLVASLEEFPQMMELRPIVIDEDGIVLGGNMRLQALAYLGHEDIPDNWVRQITGLTDKQKREFVIKDNASFGEWDWDILANEWSDLPLNNWTIEIPSFDFTGDADKLGGEQEETTKRNPNAIICPSCGYEID